MQASYTCEACQATSKTGSGGGSGGGLGESALLHGEAATLDEDVIARRAV